MELLLDSDLKKATALVEAILFMEAEAMDEAALCRASGLSRETVEAALAALAERYGDEASGLELSRVGGGASISPKREQWESLKDRYGKKNEGKISRAAMETLAIIAYSQPITRAEIKALRGVSPDNMIHLLEEKALIRETGKKDAPGRPVQYGTTKEFLKHFRLDSIADLPKLSESDLDRFELEGEMRA
ncbi:MAG: SMC-Scp complex subunit ScpB [Treponema sp.]|nr:SMC-Scp complex subunit ScpB [Treponema sp.]